MAKHMAAGIDFPVFFYGQAYMGSLEPAISALFCRILGSSGFAVCLGTAFVGMLLLPVVYAWARDAAGRAAGLAALAYCVIGPSGYVHYLASPRGGYAIAVLAGPLILWLAVRIILRELNGRPCKLVHYAGLGVLAGLAWWSTQLTTAALATAGLLLAVTLWRKAFTLKPLAGLLGFFVGSLPFWLWNATHGWQTFGFVHSFGKTAFRRGLKLFFVDCMFGLFDVTEAATAIKAGVVAIHAAALMGALFVTACAIRKNKLRGPHLHVVAALIFFVISAVLFSRSHFATLGSPRYLLPLVPAIALLAGVATQSLSRRIPAPLAWIPLLALIAWQMQGPRFHYRRTHRAEGFRERVQDLGSFLETNGVSTVYTPYIRHGLNFMLGERFRFCSLGTDRYLPYSQAAEPDSNVAVLSHYDRVHDFLKATGATAERGGAGRLQVRYRFSGPKDGMAEIPPADVAGIVDSRGRTVTEPLMDGNCDTFWQPASHAIANGGIHVRFSTPRQVTAVRLVPRDLTYPLKWRVETRENAEWCDALPVTHMTPFYWSGPRPYWGGRAPRIECRFASRMASEMRICFDVRDVEIAELQIFGLAPEPVPETAALPRLLETLRANGIRSLYSDRWVANQVHWGTQGGIRTAIEPDIFRDCDTVLPSELELSPDSALLVRGEDAGATERCLEDRNIAMRRTEVGPWLLLDFGPDQWRDEYAAILGLRWCGFGVLRAETKKWSRTLIRQAETAHAGDDLTGAIALLREALQVYDNYRPARGKLAHWLAEAGRDDEAARERAKAEGMWEPAVAAPVGFKNGARFLGLDVPHTPVKPGQPLEVAYYWRCPPEVETEKLAVFAHFKSGDSLFQDDHILLHGLPVAYQPYPDEVLIERRAFLVPPDIPPGDYAIELGLHDRDPPAERLRPKTELPNRRRAVTLPAVVTVGEWKPGIAARIGFDNGARFLGLDLPQAPVEPGQTFRVRYYWQCPPEVEADQIAVFVHFRNGDSRFQDDHVFLDGLRGSYQPYYDGVFVEERTVSVPRDIPPGDYYMEFGLHDRNPPADRLRPQTGLPKRKGAVTLPTTITVDRP